MKLPGPIHVKITRGHKSSSVTMGMLKIDGLEHKPIYTLELPWKENKSDVSCIPEGRYLCKPYSSEKYKDVYEITGVKDRSKILLHQGNTVDDIKGCIICGNTAGYLNGKEAVLNSENTLDYIKSVIGKMPFFLIIE